LKIAVVGTGYVGLVSGVCLADIGNEVVCVDVDKKKIENLKKGKSPIYEPGLQEVLDLNSREGRVRFTTDINSAIQESEVVFSAVGTPMGENHEADLTYVKQVAASFSDNLNGYKVLVTKSTVPVGTGEMIKGLIRKKTDKPFDIVSNPEFLREGNAVKDFMIPDRIVVGCESEKAAKVMKEVYQPIIRTQSPLIITDIKSAELIKYAANSMLATRISFMNEIAQFCDLVGANVKEVARGIGLDNRIGPRFLQAGAGYGGSCFPKDVAALIESGKAEKHDFKILNAVEDVNEDQRRYVVGKLRKHLQDLKGKKIAVWGLAFKPKTDDVRKAPAADIIKMILGEGGEVTAFDPIAQDNFKEFYSSLDIDYKKNRYDALKGADALLLLTEWNEFRSIDYDKLEQMNNKLIIDGRNIYAPEQLTDRGVQYEGIGYR
jgi:UDPglucose 6-dehydrogenase